MQVFGACSKALERMGIEHEILDAVEIDKYAIESFNAIHGTEFKVQDICKWDKEIEVDLIMHGSPCQDFSVAGLNKGGDEGTGTRSSLMYETIRIVEKLKPKYVVWENVKNLLSKKHRHNFDNYIDQMNELGYNSYYKVLNSKDYGIPQNRERVFTISIRKDIDKRYTFPHKEELKLRLKDMLEDKVDEKYYLSDKAIEGLKFQETLSHKPNYIENKDIVNTIDTKVGDGTHFSPYIREPKVNRIGGIFDKEKSTHQAGSIYDKEGISPTLDAMQGGWRQPSILIKNATKQGYLEAEDGDGVYTNASNKRGMVQKGIAQTLTGFQDKGVVVLK